MSERASERAREGVSEGVATALKPQTLDHHRTLLNLDRGTMQDEAATSKT